MARPEPDPAEQGDRGIGEVLEVLRAEFADVTISKIRFLEAEGLVTPARTAAGYRRFGPADVERLRYVLTVQRDQYLPLRVIREHLEALDRGLRPSAGGRPVAPAATEPAGLPVAEDFAADGTELRLTRDELCAAAEISPELLDQLTGHQLVVARDGHYDGDAIGIARTAAAFARYGVEPRHLRPFRAAADREAGLIEQVAGPRRDETARELAALAVRLHAGLVRSRLHR